MNKIEKIIAIVTLSLGMIFGGIYIFVNLMGKSILIGRIESLTHRKTSIGYFYLSPALNLEIRDFNVEGLAKINSMFLSPNIPFFLTGKAAFKSLRIVSPEFTFTKKPVPVVNAGAISATNPDVKLSSPSLAPAPKRPAFKGLPLGFRRIRIENAKVNFIDQASSPNAIKITVKDLNATLSNLYLYPRPVATAIELTGKIPWREGEVVGQVDFDGWFNLYKKDMKATLKIKDIDAIYLYPYYSNWVDLEKARIEKAKLNLSVDLNGLNNELTADCRLELTDMVRKPLEPGQTNEKAAKITDKVLDLFKAADQGKVELHFTIKTKMDSPHFGFGDFKGAFEDKLAKTRGATGLKPEDALAFPFKVLENGVRGFTDLSRAMIDGVFAIGGEIGKAATGALKKEPPASK